ncbi:hypothetical protein [Paractinoplanes maris]|uniref:hypothetical protein n=1 Tax=Paractinoplanes maris TaxID=1734446 RepID=UPI002020BC2F|nr:hypothetical protein [Actinoplanes maris]
MRLKHSLALARMLMLFFSRRVLRKGALRAAPVRLAVAVGLVALLVMGAAVAYSFLKDVGGDTEIWRFLFEVSTVSLILWVQIAFLIVKILFMNSEEILELSFQLPVTNRERSVAFMIYEISMTGIVVALGAFSFSVAALLVLGPAAIPQLLVSIILPVVLAYLLLSAIYQILARVVGFLRLRSIENVLLILALFVLLVFYSSRMQGLVLEASQAYLNKDEKFAWATAVSWVAHQYGAPAAIGAATALAIAVFFLVIRLAPSRYIRHSRYIDVPAGRWARRLLGPYDWCLLRSSQTMVNATTTLVLFVYLLFDSKINPIWSFAILSVGGLYQFAATQPLRVLVGTTSSHWRIYGLLIRAQLILLALFALPGIAILWIVDAQALGQGSTALLGCVSGVLITTCVGIIFPSEKDNPFSVFVGMSLVGALLALAVISVGLLQLPPVAIAFSFAGILLLLVWYGVYAIKESEMRRRNVKGKVGGELRSRSHNFNRGERSSSVALPHVLDG